MFTYSGDPSNSGSDEVRFLTGDTMDGVHLLEDEEIAYLLDSYPTVRTAAVYAVKAMLAKVNQDTLQSADGIVRDLKGRREGLKERLAELQRSAGHYVGPFVGGTSITERDVRRADEALIQPAFGRDDDSRESRQWPSD